ncbi:MAG: molecular chaperone TorD family protein [Coriobacteriales bacterium]|jgi:TorA maturation chaperone TorD|nr:molecular chaperone TorD family protein [Coriobacteriales bacterium]
MTAKSQLDVLQREKVTLDLLSNALLDTPDSEWLKSLVAQDVFSGIPFAMNQQNVQEGLKLLQDWSASFDPKSDETQSDYMRLFIGPGKPLAPPWETMFLSDDALLFQMETLEVRSWYRAYDLESKKLHHEPDDHIALELEFVSFLTDSAVRQLQEGDSVAAETFLGARSDFLSSHLLRWCFDWCQTVDENAKGLFYQGIAKLVAGTMKELGGS